MSLALWWMRPAVMLLALALLVTLAGLLIGSLRHSQEIAVVGAASGSQKRTLTLFDIEAGFSTRIEMPASIAYAEWTPDGRFLTFTSSEEPGGMIWFPYQLQNGQVTLFDALPQDSFHIHWSADGRPTYLNIRRSTIWISDPDGRNARQISLMGDIGKNPAWSASGEWLSYQRTARQGNTGDIMIETAIVNTESGDLLDALSHGGAWFDFSSSSWSPTDDRLAYLVPAPQDQHFQLRLYDVAARSNRVLVDEVTLRHDLTWSPDGRYIAIITHNGIRIVDSQQREAVRTLNVTQSYGPLRWSPDGHRLAFVGVDQSLNYNLYTLDLRTPDAVPRPFETDIRDWDTLAWRP